ncbi:MAG TPA: zinc-binding alcohol dehydrogenase family protein [Propylenella sp.]|nr:zinc-binding alcohol dehydrogenase family protein [Propylenella sp.]
MKTIVCLRPGELALEERPLPERGREDVLIRIRRIGLCGTDYHIFEGLHPYLQYPRIMGHELSAEVVEAPEASEFRPGDPVIVIPYLSCGTCVACRKGKTNCCTTLACLGVHCDGGMAERIVLPERNLIRAEGLSLDEAAMVEFLAIGAHAVRRAGIVPGDRALVVGAGPIGIGVALFAGIGGAQVTLMDRAPAILDLAASITGVSSKIIADEAAMERTKAATAGELFDVVFDATGNAAAMEKSFDYVASGGAYVLVGVVKDRLSFSHPDFHRREITLLGSRNATRQDFDTVVAAMRAGRVPAAAIKTHSCSLEDLPQQMPRWIHDRTGVVMAMVRMPGAEAA